MPKWCKTIVALLLLPVCAGAGRTLWLILQASGEADTVWVGLAAGAACWVVIYWLLPKPMWIYVFGHELTHAIWTWLMGGRVKRFKATSQGGSVVVTKNNFLIALAPYFFPLYALLVVGGFSLCQWLGHWTLQPVWFHLLLGAAYAFHLTLNWHVLKSKQSDITDQGYLFSAVVIFLGNILVLLIAVPLLTGKVTVFKAFSWWGACTVDIIQRLVRLF